LPPGTRGRAGSRARTRPRRRTRGIPLLERAYVQIGIFSVQENANNTGQTLRNAGLVPTIYDQTSNGRRFWRVVVGPAPTAEDRAAVLDTVRGLGFGDAYFVSR
jgi:rare lipoprotein A